LVLTRALAEPRDELVNVQHIAVLEKEVLGRPKPLLHRLKGGLSGERPIFRNLLSLLKEYLESRADLAKALFLGHQGRLKTRRVPALFREYAAAAESPPSLRHVHVLRHSTAVHLLDSGEATDFVRDFLGHALSNRLSSTPR
jgi:site-specific recombinase XerC